VLQALRARDADIETLWVGSRGGMEGELVKHAGIPFDSIPAAGLHGVGISALPRNMAQLASGFMASRRVLRRFRPDVLFFTGGYLAGPMALAGSRVPTALYVPDIEPGLALKALARLADRICVTAGPTQHYFSKPVTVTGYPVRSDLLRWTKQEGRRSLQLDRRLPVLLVAGGSTGARSINRALLANLEQLLKVTQVVHLTGRGEFESVARATSRLSEEQRARYRAFAFLDETMGAALAAADFAVMRAGASILGELPAFGLPAILAPYPHAWRYQWVNARYLVEHQAAILIEDAALEQELLGTVKSLLQDRGRSDAMRLAMRSLAHPEAADAVASQLMELGGHRA
jgi:UDP-N-acetylglucosamine--N-acetylmuramyl-(pentapeptide) pyrophosphoryl-undecaprenol N-acetylglucosamine transferase